MKRPIDLTALTRAERIVLVSGVLLFANGFIPWWYRVSTAEGSTSYNAGLTGWSTVAVCGGAVAAVVVIARAWIWPRPAPRIDGGIYAALGTLAVIAVGIEMRARNGRWIGLGVALALAIAVTAGGIKRRAERAAGWR